MQNLPNLEEKKKEKKKKKGRTNPVTPDL